MRHALPNRFVTGATIEDAYVGFILYCNPAVPPETNTAALREAFRTPPRSGGKSFAIYTLYLLICELEQKRLKTWAELALKLGVEPPDQDSGQSSQKIQQYAVRLKRWMHSMHVDAFFDYLMDRQHDYWTDVPSDLDAIGDYLRDGVAAKDDMALRALVPEIKPRRGRRRPDDDGHPLHYQHPDDAGAANAMAWTNPAAWADGYWDDRTASPQPLLPSKQSRYSGRRHGAKVVSSAWRSSNGTGSSGKTRGRPPIHRSTPRNKQQQQQQPQQPQQLHSQQPNHSPLSSFPMDQAASFDASYSSQLSASTSPELTDSYASSAAMMPMVPQLPTPDAEATSSAFSRPDHLSLQVPEHAHADVPMTNPSPAVAPLDMLNGDPAFDGSMAFLGTGNMPAPPLYYGSFSGCVAGLQLMDFPPSAAELNGQQFSHVSHTPHVSQASHDLSSLSSLSAAAAAAAAAGPSPCMYSSPMASGHNDMVQAVQAAAQAAQAAGMPADSGGQTLNDSTVALPTATGHPGHPGQFQAEFKTAPLYELPFYFSAQADRTNMDEAYAHFMRVILCAHWRDRDGRPIGPCSADEASALADSMMTNLVRGAPSVEALLLNLAIVTGSQILMAHSYMEMRCLESNDDFTQYDMCWELRFGAVHGRFHLIETVPRRHQASPPAAAVSATVAAAVADSMATVAARRAAGGTTASTASTAASSVASACATPLPTVTISPMTTAPMTTAPMMTAPPTVASAATTTSTPYATPPDMGVPLPLADEYWKNRYQELVQVLQQQGLMQAPMFDGLRGR